MFSKLLGLDRGVLIAIGILLLGLSASGIYIKELLEDRATLSASLASKDSQIATLNARIEFQNKQAEKNKQVALERDEDLASSKKQALDTMDRLNNIINNKSDLCLTSKHPEELTEITNEQIRKIQSLK